MNNITSPSTDEYADFYSDYIQQEPKAAMC